MLIVVTGASGFVGSGLLPLLTERHNVTAIARTSAPPNLMGVDWVEHDLTSELPLDRLPKRVDAVVHLAQSQLYRRFPEGAEDMFAVNIASTMRFLEYARAAGATRFVLASSGGVYGSSYERLVETDPVNPLNFYLTSKYVSELLIANYRVFFHAIVFRFFFVYGPGQRGMLVPTLVRRVVDGEEILVAGRPGLKVNPIFVDDAVRAFEPALALDRSEVFNIAGDEAVTMTELVSLIGDVAGREPIVRYSDDEGPGDLVADNGRLRDVLGVTPHVTLRDGIGRMVEAFAAASQAEK
jgi:nucleoside-diphosphate-sugar epimerase